MSKIVKCKGCGAEMMKGTKKCPQCGKKNKRPTGLIVIGIIVLCIVFSSVNSSIKSARSKKVKYSWPTTGIATLLPQPKSEYGEIDYDSEDYFSIVVYNVSQKSFNEYTDSCKEKGFTVDYKGSSSDYSAEDPAGNSLQLFYSEGKKELDISVRAYEEQPEQDVTENNTDSVTEAASTEEAVEESTEGTAEESSEESTEGTAEESSGESTEGTAGGSPEESIEEQSDAEPTEESETESSQESKAESEVQNDAGFRAWVDSYEEFINEYVDFMKKYEESDGTDLSLLADYATIMSKYTEYLEKTDGIDEDELSAEDWAYYMEAEARILKKLSEIQ